LSEILTSKIVKEESGKIINNHGKKIMWKMGMKRRRKDMGKQQMKLQDFQNALFTIPHVYEQLSNKN